MATHTPPAPRRVPMRRPAKHLNRVRRALLDEDVLCARARGVWEGEVVLCSCPRAGMNVS